MSHLASLHTDTIFVEPYVGPDSNNDPEYGPQEKRRARHQQGSVMIRDSDGVSLESTDQLSTIKAIGSKDRVWLPGTNPEDERDARLPVLVRSAARPNRTLSHHRTFF